MTRAKQRRDYTKAADVLDLQGRVVDALNHRNTAHYFAEIFRQRTQRTPNVAQFGDKEHEELGRLYVAKVSTAMRASYAFYASDEMMQLVDFAAESLPATATCEADLFPTPIGFAVFEEPIEFAKPPDTDSNLPQRIKAIFWQHTHTDDLVPGTSGVQVTTFCNMHDYWNDMDAALALIDPREKTVTVTAKQSGESIQYEVAELHRYKELTSGMWGSLIPTEVIHIPYERRIGNAPKADNFDRWLCAYITMMNQTVVELAEEEVPRAFARRAKRMNLPQRVNVIRLRRATRPHEGQGQSSVEWKHQWFVRGHWRNQPYGPGRTQTRRIWISPFVKGPEGAPVLLSEKVYALVR